ncbi:class I SAM-dependent methyltransferase [Saccharothrix violaceirubra]|uniref:Putative nicotinamide N-methyase n=1 Tax=Saccharothrix violaceirubra TaxID=413306 RepID=A0A7W7WWC2_9PSEU|nr:50S ribosomal protein L11 methyltransferase [Saccharothrix violaceirubra]MBB4965941.1 putative nicotinamide N-methyase [Saccharothrix violaceirubra]
MPHVPEIHLHTGDDITTLWEHTHHPDPPFWAYPWAGGQALARHLLDHPHHVTGHHVLDLATGSGLVAIAAALAGATTVTANDIDPHAATATRLNAHANHVTLTVDLRDLLDTEPHHDVVLAGDVFYDQTMADRVLPYLRRAHTSGALVLAGDPHRHHRPRTGFTTIARHDVPVHPALEGSHHRATAVLRAT